MGYNIDYKSLGCRRVLVVEDVELNQYLARHIMESWGFEVEIAVNGAEALNYLENKTYDLILMDIQMPIMDGIEATKQIRKLPDPVRSNIPIVALTANTFKEDVDTYFEVGMNDCLPKPFDEPRLFRMVSKTLKSTSECPTLSNNENTTTAPTLKPYDLSMVIAISGGDKEFVKRMAKLFVDTIPDLLNELDRANESGNWDTVGRIAHRLKSTIDSMGIATLKTDIRSLEKLGREASSIETIPTLVIKVRKELEICMMHVRNDFELN